MSLDALPVPIYEVSTADLTFSAIGDWGSSNAIKNLNVKVMGREALLHGSQFTLLLGDNFYEDGVESCSDPKWKDTFEIPFSEAVQLQDKAFHAILGNHDWKGNVNSQIAYKSPSGMKWDMPEVYHSNVYRFRNEKGGFFNVLFLFIETTVWVDDSKIAGDPRREILLKTQEKFIEDTLRDGAKFADYIFISGHHGVYSVGAHGSHDRLKNFLRPLFYKYGVDAYLCGHDHSFQILSDLGHDLENLVDVTPLKRHPDAVVVPKASKDLNPQHVNYKDYLTNILFDENGITKKNADVDNFFDAKKTRNMPRRRATGIDQVLKLETKAKIQVNIKSSTTSATPGSLRFLNSINQDGEASEDLAISSSEALSENDTIAAQEERTQLSLNSFFKHFKDAPDPYNDYAEHIRYELMVNVTDVSNISFNPDVNDLGTKVEAPSSMTTTSSSPSSFLHPTLYFLVGSGGKRDYSSFRALPELLYGAQAFGTSLFKISNSHFTMQGSGLRGNRLATVTREKHPYRACIKKLGVLPKQSELIQWCGNVEEQDALNGDANSWGNHADSQELKYLLPKIPLLGEKWIDPDPYHPPPIPSQKLETGEIIRI